jgi:antitoxin component of MazEF toxin-antitoxin module
MKVQEGSNGQKLVTIPKDLAKAMGIEKGDQVNWKVKEENVLELRKPKP